MKKFIPQGTITALVTPFKKDGSVDFDGLKKLIERQIEAGIEGIAVCSTTGESPALTLKEKQAVIVKSVEFAAGKVPIIVGTGTYETEMTRDMTLLAKEYGASAALIITPYYVKPSQEGLYEHFKLIADQVDIPQIIYNCPGRTGVNMLPETILKVAKECPNVIAVKEASGDLEQFMNIIADAPKGFSLLSGDDYLAVPGISVGAKGVISVISNYAPKQFGDAVRFALKGKFAEASKIHYELLELMNLNFVESNPVPVKHAMHLIDGIQDIIRMPLMTMKKENKALLKAALKKAGFIK